jgi:hypothetical protein
VLASVLPDDSNALLDGVYRYCLWRRWNLNQPIMGWVMLNPSTANAKEDDQTLRKCMGFARKHDHGGVILVNLFAFMERDPQKLRMVKERVGPETDRYILWTCAVADLVVAGWGACRFANEQARHVRKLVEGTGTTIRCVGQTKNGQPRHPLHPSYSSPIQALSAAYPGQMTCSRSCTTTCKGGHRAGHLQDRSGWDVDGHLSGATTVKGLRWCADLRSRGVAQDFHRGRHAGPAQRRAP